MILSQSVADASFSVLWTPAIRRADDACCGPPSIRERGWARGILGSPKIGAEVFRSVRISFCRISLKACQDPNKFRSHRFLGQPGCLGDFGKVPRPPQ